MGNTVGRIEEVPKKAVVVASTSQVLSESDLSREKVEHAFKLLGVSSRMLRVLFYRRSSSMLIFLFCRRHWDKRVSRRQMKQS